MGNIKCEDKNEDIKLDVYQNGRNEPPFVITLKKGKNLKVEQLKQILPEARGLCYTTKDDPKIFHLIHCQNGIFAPPDGWKNEERTYYLVRDPGIVPKLWTRFKEMFSSLFSSSEKPKTQ